MPRAALFALDVGAIALLTFALYFPRHRSRDMVLALLCVNVGVLAVTQALASTVISAGLGLGLFGVLSIIRLRSAEMDQGEVAYYFAALTLGLLGGVSVTPEWVSPVLMTAILVAVLVGDHPRLFGSYRRQLVTLDYAYADEAMLRSRLETTLGATVHRFTVRRVDFVEDTTIVDVRFSLPGRTLFGDTTRAGPQPAETGR